MYLEYFRSDNKLRYSNLGLNFKIDEPVTLNKEEISSYRDSLALEKRLNLASSMNHYNKKECTETTSKLHGSQKKKYIYIICPKATSGHARRLRFHTGSETRNTSSITYGLIEGKK